MSFTLDAQLAADTLSLGQIDFVDIRLMKDARYVWLVLVPRIDGAVEWHDLPAGKSSALHDVAMRCAAALQEMTQADKMNIAALGNMVRQLHVHVIARHEHDAAWPGPVWGVGTAQSYTPQAQSEICDRLQKALAL